LMIKAEVLLDRGADAGRLRIQPKPGPSGREEWY